MMLLQESTSQTHHFSPKGTSSSRMPWMLSSSMPLRRKRSSRRTVSRREAVRLEARVQRWRPPQASTELIHCNKSKMRTIRSSQEASASVRLSVAGILTEVERHSFSICQNQMRVQKLKTLLQDKLQRTANWERGSIGSKRQVSSL